jgi:hypothetical protein
MSSLGQKQLNEWTNINHTLLQRTISAKPYLWNFVSGLRFKPSTSWQKSEHTTLDNLLGISEMLLVQFTTTITLNRKLDSHIKEKNISLSLCFLKHHIIAQYYVVNWSRGLRCKSATTPLLRLWVQIPLGAWMLVASVVCCQVEVSAMSWSLVQRSPTDCGASLCVIYTSWKLEGHGPHLATTPQKKNPCSIHRPWKASSVQLANKFPSFYSNWQLISMLTEAYCWSLFLPRLLPSMPSHPVSSKYR